MAKEIVCDKCGNTSGKLMGYGHLTKLTVKRYIGLNTINDSSCDLLVDLCDDCVEKLKTFIFEGQK